MLLPHTFFTGAVTPKYSFSSNQLLNWNSFQFRKLKRFTQRGQWLRPCPLLKAAGGHLSVWFRCRCSQWHWNLGAEGPEPSLRAQPVGGPRAYSCSTPAFQERDNTLRPVELLTADACQSLKGAACKLRASLSALCFPPRFHELNGGQVFSNW